MRACILSAVHSAFDTHVFHREVISLADAGFDVRLLVPYDGDQWQAEGQVYFDDVLFIEVGLPRE